MKKQILFLIFISLFIINQGFCAEGVAMNNSKNESLTDWLNIWSDGFELDLIELPAYKIRKTVFTSKNRPTEIITHRRLSYDNKTVAFTYGTFGSSNPYEGLYVVKIATGKITKIGDCPKGAITLLGFVGNDRLLLSGYVVLENNQIVYKERDLDNMAHFYVFNFVTHELEYLKDLGATTVGMANGRCGRNAVAYETGDGVAIYDINEQKLYHVNRPGDLVAIAPDGRHILFLDKKQGYMILDRNGNELVVLSSSSINALKPIFRGYFELHFVSWSPGGQYVMFQESSDGNNSSKYLLDLESKKIKKL